MSDLLSLSDVAEKFFWHVRKNYRNQKEAASYYGVSVAFISAVVTGKKTPNARMLDDLGLKKVKGFLER